MINDNTIYHKLSLFLKLFLYMCLTKNFIVIIKSKSFILMHARVFVIFFLDINAKNEEIYGILRKRVTLSVQ